MHVGSRAVGVRLREQAQPARLRPSTVLTENRASRRGESDSPRPRWSARITCNVRPREPASAGHVRCQRARVAACLGRSSRHSYCSGGDHCPRDERVNTTRRTARCVRSIDNTSLLTAEVRAAPSDNIEASRSSTHLTLRMAWNRHPRYASSSGTSRRPESDQAGVPSPENPRYRSCWAGGDPLGLEPEWQPVSPLRTRGCGLLVCAYTNSSPCLGAAST
jgi:hypothetical protein